MGCFTQSNDSADGEAEYLKRLLMVYIRSGRVYCIIFIFFSNVCT